MLINLNIKINSVNISRLSRVSFSNFTLNLIDTSVNCNTKINLIKFSHPFCVNDFSFDDNVNLFYNINSNVIFNNKISL